MIREKIKNLFKPKLKLAPGTRFASFLFIACSMVIAAGILWAANMYYNLDTSEVIVGHIERVYNYLRATYGLIVGGSDSQNPASGYKFQVVGDSLFSGNAVIGNVSDTAQELKFVEGGSTPEQYIGLKAPTSLTTNRTYILPNHDTSPPGENYVLTWQSGNQLEWKSLSGAGGGGDITAVGSMTTGDVFAGSSASGQWLGLGSSAGRIAFLDDTTDYINLLDANVGIGTATPGQKLSVAGTFGILEGGSNPSYYTIFQGGDQSANITYTLPTSGPSANDLVLVANSDGTLRWDTAGGIGAGGDVTDVGDCDGPACFTSSGTEGTSLWFYDADGRGQLTIANLTAARTYTLPDATGTIALGTGTENYVAYWTGTNSLGSEQYLSTTRGGTGQNSSSWNGMVKVVGGTWSTTTGTQNYAAYWSDANTIAAEQYLAVSRGGTGAGTFTQYGILYGNGTSALGVTTAGTANQLLISGGGSTAPSWTNIADLITATNGLTESGTTQLTLKLGGTLSETTTISQGDYNMIFNLTGTGDFKVQDAGTDILVVSDDGKIYFKDYPLAESGKQILREAVSIFGFDLPTQCSTACDDEYAQISRTIESYPFSSAESGATRKHKLAIRYATSDTTTSIKFRVYDETTSSYVDQGGGNYDITVSASPGTDLDDGTAVMANVVLPSTSSNDWHLRLQGASDLTVRIYDILLLAYDEIE